MNKRLTEKYNDEFGLTRARIKDGIENKYYRSHRFLPVEQAMLKLAQLEDFMEEQKIDFVEDLVDEFKSDKIDKEIYRKQSNRLYQENQAFKSRWEKLKEFIEREHELFKKVFKKHSLVYQDLLRRMRELEKESKDEE